MKNLKKIVTGTLVLAMALSLCSCKSVSKIEKKDFENALEDTLDWEEDEDYREHKDTEVYATNFDDVEDPYEYDLDLSIYAYGTNISIKYMLFEDEEDADEYFKIYYEAFAKDEDDYKKSYSKGKKGYYYSKNDTYFSGMYFAEDMVIEASAFDDDAVEDLTGFLKSLDLPC